jgi:outer membrane protein TolC
VLADVLGLRAVEERNRSAASAMELYYRLAAAHFNRDRVDRSLEEVRRTVENFRKAKDTGLSVPGDEARLLNQETELVDRRVQLETGLEQLEGQLCQLLGLDAAPDQPLWPGADMTVNVSPVDVEAAVAEGLRSRPDLAELCVLRENASEETLRSIRGALARVDPLLGLASSAKHMVCPAKHRARVSLETQTRREQLDDLLEFQKRSAEGEIRRAAGDVEARLRRIGLAKDKLDQCQALWRRLRERREAKGTVQASEISAAQLEVLRAESEAFQAVVEWKIALVKLKQSQGLLAAECGYTLPAACCDGCLDAPRGRVTPCSGCWRRDGI